MHYLDDFSVAFWVIFSPLLTWLSAAMMIGGVLIAAFRAIIGPVIRHTL